MLAKRRNDHRTNASRAAELRVLELCNAGALVLGLGGGPLEVHPKIVNLNIAPLENVDVVGDAHRRPIASASIDAVHCEAVFEHLEDPADAAAELFRVMKPGAIGVRLHSFHAAVPRLPLALSELHAPRPQTAV
jgi:SAM-dependent methyltransferase